MDATRLATIDAVNEAVLKLMALLHPSDQAALAGVILAQCGVTDETAEAFVAELSDDDRDQLNEYM